MSMICFPLKFPSQIKLETQIFLFLLLSTFVIDNPRRGDRITRKQIDELRNFIKLRDSRSSDSLVIAAAFLSISDERHDDVDEFWESRRSFLIQMQLRSIFLWFFSFSGFNLISLTSQGFSIKIFYSSSATNFHYIWLSRQQDELHVGFPIFIWNDDKAHFSPLLLLKKRIRSFLSSVVTANFVIHHEDLNVRWKAMQIACSQY